MAKNPIPVFISYAHKDEAYLKELRVFLKPYEKNKTIKIWTDRNIVAGQHWDELIKTQLERSKILLFLVSPDFLASDYINDTEIRNTIENYDQASQHIIQVIIRPIDMDLLLLKDLQVIPTDAKPVSDWESRDKAWNDVLLSLKKVFNELKNGEDDGQEDDDPVTYRIPRKVRLTSQIVIWLFVLFLAASIFMILKGVWGEGDRVLRSTGFGGIGASILGYIIANKYKNI